MRYLLVLLIVIDAPAQNYVTNWVLPGLNYRMIGTQVFNVDISQRWVTLQLPSRPVSIHTTEAPAPGDIVTMSSSEPDPSEKLGAGHGHGPITLRTIEIRNYRYDPKDFRIVNNYERWPNPKGYRVFPLGATTNRWNANGSPATITMCYDFGLPCTNKIPVVSVSKNKTKQQKF